MCSYGQVWYSEFYCVSNSEDMLSQNLAEIFFAVLKPEDKEPTVFIDLRNFDQIRHEQQQSIEKVQKVLGINPNERLVFVFHFNLVIF